MSGPTVNLDAIAGRIWSDPVCELRTPAGYCSRLAVTAVATPDLRSRCRVHAPPEALYMCLTCRGVNADGGTHCRRCVGRWSGIPHPTTEAGGTAA